MKKNLEVHNIVKTNWGPKDIVSTVASYSTASIIQTRGNWDE